MTKIFLIQYNMGRHHEDNNYWLAHVPTPLSLYDIARNCLGFFRGNWGPGEFVVGIIGGGEVISRAAVLVAAHTQADWELR
jgi:hypothetical protein